MPFRTAPAELRTHLGPIPHQPFVRKGRDFVTAPETLSSTVFDLKPGARVLMPDGRAATFVQHAPHPLTPNLRLVIWKMPDGSWSHDALDLFQHVGEALAATDDERRQALREALLHRSQW